MSEKELIKEGNEKEDVLNSNLENVGNFYRNLRNKRLDIYLKNDFPKDGIYDSDEEIRLICFSKHGWTVESLHDIDDVIRMASLSAVLSQHSGLDAEGLFLNKIIYDEIKKDFTKLEKEEFDIKWGVNKGGNDETTDEETEEMNTLMINTLSTLCNVSVEELQDKKWAEKIFSNNGGTIINDFFKLKKSLK